MIEKKTMSQCLTVDYCKGWNDAVDAISRESNSNSVCDSNLQYRALMGDKNAQEECTHKKIILPCPCCGGSLELMNVEPHSEHIGKLEYEYEGGSFLTCKCGYSMSGDNEEDVIRKHNSRPAIKIYMCKFCHNKKRATVNKKGFLICPVSGMEITDTDFCSYFDPEQDEELTDEEMSKVSGYLCPTCKHHKLCTAPGMRPLCMETYDYFERDESVK